MRQYRFGLERISVENDYTNQGKCRALVNVAPTYIAINASVLVFSLPQLLGLS